MIKKEDVIEKQLTFTQMIDVMYKAIEIQDWKMLEDVAYQLKLMKRSADNVKSFQKFILLKADYNFDWTTEE